MTQDTKVILCVDDEPGMLFVLRELLAPCDHDTVVEIEDDGCGTGLGLSITNDIIQKHTGTLSISSTLGSGSCFAVHLPWSA